MPSTDSEHEVSAKVIETLLYFSMSQTKDIFWASTKDNSGTYP